MPQRLQRAEISGVDPKAITEFAKDSGLALPTSFNFQIWRKPKWQPGKCLLCGLPVKQCHDTGENRP